MRVRRMKYNVILSVRQVWPLAIAFITLSLPFSLGSDPKIFQIPLSDVDISIQITRKAQVGESIETSPSAIGKPTQVDTPKVLRHPDAIYGSSLFRPAAGGEALIYSGDNRQVITGGSDGAIRFFDSYTGEPQNVIEAHPSEVLELARIPNSKVIVSSDFETTKFWDTTTSQELMRLRRGGRGLSVSPNGRFVFTGFQLWEIESTNPLRLSAFGRGYPQAGNKVIISWTFFTPDNRYLVFGVQNSYVYIWDLQSDKVRRVHDIKSTAMRSLTWGDLKGVVDIGEAQPGDLLALALDQYTILTGTPSILESFQETIAKEKLEARCLACSPDGQFLAALGYQSRLDVFDLERGGTRNMLDGHTAGLQAVAASPDGRMIASGGDDKAVILWDRVSHEKVAMIATQSFVYSLCFSKDGRKLAIGDNDSNVYLYDVASKAIQKTTVQWRVTGLIFDSTSKILFALGAELAALDSESGERLASIPAESASQGVITMTPEQLILGSSNSMSANETFKVPCSWSWDGHQFVRRDDLFGKEMGHASTIHAITTSSDGSLCAAESSSTIRFWDLKQKQSVGQEMSDHSNRITDMKFSPDGKYLASGAWDGTVRIWEVPSGRRRLILDADVAGISSLAFLPDGSLITANGNGTVHLWNLPKHLLEN